MEKRIIPLTIIINYKKYIFFVSFSVLEIYVLEMPASSLI